MNPKDIFVELVQRANSGDPAARAALNDKQKIMSGMTKRARLTGAPMDDIFFNENTAPVNVTIDTGDISGAITQASSDQQAILLKIVASLEENSDINREFIIRCIKLLLEQQQESQTSKEPKEIKGLKIVRDKSDKMNSLEFIR